MSATPLNSGARRAADARRDFLRASPLLMPYVYFACFALLILLLKPNLLTGPGMLQNRMSLIVPLAFVAFGQTLVVVSRGIDLSVGGVMSLCSSLLATSLNHSGPQLVLDLVFVLALGAGIGVLNGVLIANLRLQPFLVTLATWTIGGGVAFAVLPVEGGVPSSTLVGAVQGKLAGVPVSALVLVALFLAWLWVRRTVFFIDLVAIGSDESRAWLTGVRVDRRKIQSYALTGLFAAAAAIWLTAQSATGSPRVGDEYILASIVAVVLGGTSIFGGTGSAASSVMGAMAYMLIPVAVYALHLQSYWSIAIQGMVLMFAVVANAGAQSLVRGAGK